MRMLLQRSEPLATGCSSAWRGTVGLTGLAVVVGAAAAVGVQPARAQDGGLPPPAVAQFQDVTVAAERPPEAGKTADAEPPQDRREELEAQLAKAEADAKVYRERLQKVRATEAARAKKSPSAAPTAPPAAVGPAAPAMTPAAFGGGAGGVQLDLVNLANSLVDASGAYKQAKITFEQRQRLQKSGAFNEVEVAEARARLETAQKRVELLRAIAQAALETAKVNHARVKQLYQMGMEGADRYEELAGKVKVLELIVRGAE
jgi:hypothetical protein